MMLPENMMLTHDETMESFRNKTVLLEAQIAKCNKAWVKAILSDKPDSRWIAFKDHAVCQFAIPIAEFEALKELAK